METEVISQKKSHPSTVYDKLILSVWQRHRQRHRDYKRKMKARRKLYETLTANLDLKFDLFVVGSTQTQFSLRTSDMDLCMLVYDDQGRIDERFLYDRKTKIALLRTIKHIIERKLHLRTEVTVLETARVPILKIERTNAFFQTALDLNVNGDLSIRNTFLLTLYQEIDARVAPLVVAVKSWARKQGIDSPFHGTLSSYSLSLLVIHYLQNCDPPVLPKIAIEETYQAMLEKIVQTGYIQEQLDILLFEVRKQFYTLNDWSLGRLFYNFFEYYVGQFGQKNLFFSVRTNPNAEGTRADLITIEDPFLLHNTASTVTVFTACRIIKAFREALLSLAGFTFSRKHLDL